MLWLPLPNTQNQDQVVPPWKKINALQKQKMSAKEHAWLRSSVPGLGVTAAAPPMLVWIWSGWLGPAAGGEHQAWYGSEYSEYAELLPCEHCWQQPARLFLIQLSVLPVICGGAGRCRSRTGQPTPHFGGKNKWSLFTSNLINIWSLTTDTDANVPVIILQYSTDAVHNM